jgi:hypothetical protein
MYQFKGELFKNNEEIRQPFSCFWTSEQKALTLHACPPRYAPCGLQGISSTVKKYYNLAFVLTIKIALI